MDGEVIIKSTLDTTDFEKQLKEQERQLREYERDEKKLLEERKEVELDTTQAKARLEELNKDIERLQGVIKHRKTLEMDFENKGAIERVSGVLNGFEKERQEILDGTINRYNVINQELEDNKRNQEILTQEIRNTNEEIKKQKGLNNFKNIIKDIGKETEKNIKKVGGWILALFGVRAIYGAIKKSISIISEHDKQLKDDLTYIQIAMAYMLEPIVRKIVEWVKLLLQYLGYIIYMWTGIDIWKNAEKGLKNANKQAKELKKQLAGFDEANVLSDNKGNESISPSFKLGGYEDVEPPKWLVWIVDHSKEIFAILTGITLALTLIKLGIDWITASGFGLLIAGVVYAVASLIDYLNDPSWSNFGEIIIGIGVALTAVGLIFGAWPVLLGGVCLAIVGIVIKYWDKIKEKLDEGVKWLEDKSDWVHQMFGDEIGDLYDFIVDMIKKTIDWFDYIFNAMKGVLDGIIQFVQGVFEGNWKKALNGIIKIGENAFKLMYAPIKLIFDGILSSIGLIKERAKSIINWMIDGINKMINGLNKIKIDKPSWLGGGQWGINIPTIPKLATGGIVNMPNRGVMVGGAIAGESGREGVIPLTDPYAMAQLGEQIGRWVNLAIDNKMVVDGRVLATATNNQINKENFLMNR